MTEASSSASPGSAAKARASLTGIHRLRTFVLNGQWTRVPNTCSPNTVTSQESFRPSARVRVVWKRPTGVGASRPVTPACWNAARSAARSSVLVPELVSLGTVHRFPCRCRTSRTSIVPSPLMRHGSAACSALDDASAAVCLAIPAVIAAPPEQPASLKRGLGNGKGSQMARPSSTGTRDTCLLLSEASGYMEGISAGHGRFSSYAPSMRRIRPQE